MSEQDLLGEFEDPPALASHAPHLKAIPADSIEWPEAPRVRHRAARVSSRGEEAGDAESSAAVPEPAAAAPVPAPVPAPELGEILSAQERGRYEQRFEASLDRAQQNLAQVRARQLRRDDLEVVRRIEAFLGQASLLRAHDLPTACALADRADLLAQDLVRRLR